MNKYKYNINNLDCANCARRIEEGLNKNNQLNNVVVNFNTSKISYESSKELNLKQLNKLISTIEPDSYASLDEVKHTKEYHASILIIGVLSGILGVIKMPYNINMTFTILAYIILLYRPFVNAIKTLIKNKSINENMLITISCLGAFLVGEHMEGLMVVALYILGKILEEKAINNTRRSIKNLLDIKQDYANLKTDDGFLKVDVDQIKINDILIVKKGERVPVDGIIHFGNTKLDTSSLTGESQLVNMEKGDKVLSGSINNGDVIEIKVTNLFKDSTVSKILELVEDATDKKANTETLVSRLSKIYTPVVLILAVLVSVLLPLITDLSLNESIYRGLTFLVISCPCAIAISVPLSYFTGIGISSKNGILVKGSNYLDNLGNIKKIIFDKTGTLTTGSFEVTNINVTDKSYSKQELIDILTKGESLSNHPIAQSIMRLTDKTIDNKEVTNFKEIEGKGITFELNNKKIKIGSLDMCKNCHEEASIHVAIDNKHVASIMISDGIKENTNKAIDYLHKLGIKTYMFTGDKKSIALEIGNRLNIDEIKYEMLPTDKYQAYESIKENNELVAFVGDGVNDAPVLKRSDIGISMGSIGTDSAIEASDIVIMKDDLIKITDGIKISKYTNYIIKQNLIFAIGIKIIILLLSIFGYASMWSAVFADTGVTLLTILNTLRIMKKFK